MSNKTKPDEDIANVVEEPVEQKTMIGTVVGCMKLNVRRRANKKAEILCTIDCDTEVEIVDNKPTSQFYKVCLASGVAGYCMKEFISVK